MSSLVCNLFLALCNLMHFHLLWFQMNDSAITPAEWMIVPLGLLSVLADLSDQSHGLQGVDFFKNRPALTALIHQIHFYFWICLLFPVGAYMTRQLLISTTLLEEAIVWKYEIMAWVIVDFFLVAFPKMNHWFYTYFLGISRFLQAYIVCGLFELWSYRFCHAQL